MRKSICIVILIILAGCGSKQIATKASTTTEYVAITTTTLDAQALAKQHFNLWYQSIRPQVTLLGQHLNDMSNSNGDKWVIENACADLFNDWQQLRQKLPSPDAIMNDLWVVILDNLNEGSQDCLQAIDSGKAIDFDHSAARFNVMALYLKQATERLSQLQ